MIAFCGSMTRRYTTALTFTDTLSREITSWVGTSSTTVRRSTRTACWMIGTMMTSPGPLTCQKRPSVNTTPRSYSRKMRMALSRNRTASATSMKPPPIQLKSRFVISVSLCGRLDRKHEAIHAHDAHPLATPERYIRAYLPHLAVDARERDAALVIHDLAD